MTHTNVGVSVAYRKITFYPGNGSEISLLFKYKDTAWSWLAKLSAKNRNRRTHLAKNKKKTI